jgi:thiol:disulfide interchange protein
MIPINVAIIGAGVGAGSRWRGLALGGLYGLGIALAYGALGVLVLLTGWKFGTLNASPWFNFGVAALFLFLALGMFEVFLLDFSRFQSRLFAGPEPAKRSYGTAFVMGAVSALLAGACVAPAVISMLVFAAALYGRGVAAALLLPFLLGLGMGLPWPFVGAGLARLPKPGAWMKRINRIFGAVILAAALYFGYEGYMLLRSRSADYRAQVASSAAQAAAEHGWLTSLPDAMQQARETQKPLLIDFWASWCKNCLAMEATTLQTPKALRALEGFVKVKYNAEQPGEMPDQEILDCFNVVGLPAYVVLRPVPPGTSQQF